MSYQYRKGAIQNGTGNLWARLSFAFCIQLALLVPVHAVTQTTQTADNTLLKAAKDGDLQSLRRSLKQGADPNAQAQPPKSAYMIPEFALAGRSPVNIARGKRQLKIVTTLLKAGAKD